jgi:multidrug resistance efflux pump
MSPFVRSRRLLTADGFGRSVPGLLIAILLLALWAAWFFQASINLYETSTTAHLEVTPPDSSLGQAVRATIGGRLAVVHQALGQVVQAGDMLFELDAATGRLTIIAPTSGQIGTLTNLQIGAIVDPGHVLATIVPRNEFKVVADFPASQALGRLHAGQPARVRLDNFSWTEYGGFSATVVRIASETHEGQVQVELMLDSNQYSPISLQHGLVGAVEVEVDRASPAALLLRTLGGAATRASQEASR